MSIFSKIESGENKIIMERFSLNILINKIVLSYKKDATAREIQIESRLDNGSDIANLNSIAMKMVLSNLIGNAIKYNRKGGMVSISTSGGDDGLVIAIEDSGLGIAPADMPHIFDRFYRSKSVEGYVTGSGIGLYIVKTLVEAMDGNIKVESSLGKGSKFIVTFNSATGEAENQNKGGEMKRKAEGL
jgi:two-component system phosphate regulon sensor histidine kinase PhoR